MQPIGSVFGKFSRVIRDMARDLGKEIDLQVEGSEVELDKSMLELLGDPLTHIMRNCADHALETPEEREKAGKKRMGRILLRAFHEGGQVNITVSDDGRGIDSKKVLAKAIEKGLVKQDEGEKMSERDIIRMVFAPGFSTAEVVTDVSGRGVGMDVVRTNIEKLGGHIEVDTAVNEGTTVLLRLPLTLAIIPSLIVGVGKRRFAVPQVNLVELVWVRANEVKDRIENVHGAAVLRLRGRLLPLVRLADVLGIERIYKDPDSGEEHEERRTRLPDQRSADLDKVGVKVQDRDPVERSGEDRRHDWHGDYNILVLQVGSNQFGVVVDELFDSEEIVVKPLSGFLKDCKCFAGATILGDGRVIMILDASGVAVRAGLRFADMQAEEQSRLEEEARKEAAAAAARRSIILFNSARDEYFAVPQEKILRLEQIKLTDIEEVGGKEFIQYRGAGLPLIRLEHHLSVNPLALDTEMEYLLIPKVVEEDGTVAEAAAGIMVSNIIDAIDVEVTMQECSLVGPGLLGSAIVQGKLTVFLDPTELLEAAGLTGSLTGGVR
jgi:two-component system, chemotaxis family, sensor kinase CheA